MASGPAFRHYADGPRIRDWALPRTKATPIWSYTKYISGNPYPATNPAGSRRDTSLRPTVIGGYGPSMPFGVGYRRPYGTAFGYGGFNRNTRRRFNPVLGRFRGRFVRRFGSAPLRSAGFRAIRAGRSGLNNPAGRMEKKFLDNVFESGVLQFDTTGTVTVLNGMAQGTSQSTRIGNKITMRSCYLRYRVTNSAATTGALMFRVMVIYDTQTNATTPALSDILQTGPADPTMRVMNLANRDRFKILYEDTFTPVGTVVSDTTGVTEFQEYRQKYLKLNLDTIYNNTSGGTVADIQTGGLFLVTMSNFPTGASEPTGVATVRIRYTDV